MDDGFCDDIGFLGGDGPFGKSYVSMGMVR